MIIRLRNMLTVPFYAQKLVYKYEASALYQIPNRSHMLSCLASRILIRITSLSTPRFLTPIRLRRFGICKTCRCWLQIAYTLQAIRIVQSNQCGMPSSFWTSSFTFCNSSLLFIRIYVYSHLIPLMTSRKFVSCQP